MEKIKFIFNFHCIICLDSELPDKAIFQKLDKVPIFAADGAVFKLNKIDIVADKIIGDLDTFYRDIEHINYSKSKLVYYDDQDTNDFEKVLIYAKACGFKNCLVLGMNGGELEHTLNNWSVFIKYSKQLNLTIFTENRYGFIVSSDVEIDLEKNETVSLIPQFEAIVSTENLNWELSDTRLAFGTNEGARNFAKSEKVKIYVHSGELLIFVNQKLPFSPNQIHYT